MNALRRLTLLFVPLLFVFAEPLAGCSSDSEDGTGGNGAGGSAGSGGSGGANSGGSGTGGSADNCGGCPEGEACHECLTETGTTWACIPAGTAC
jgi:hypothetical protein